MGPIPLPKSSAEQLFPRHYPFNLGPLSGLGPCQSWAHLSGLGPRVSPGPPVRPGPPYQAWAD